MIRGITAGLIALFVAMTVVFVARADRRAPDGRGAGRDHRSSPYGRSREHDRGQDRNFVPAFTSGYRGTRLPSRPE